MCLYDFVPLFYAWCALVWFVDSISFVHPVAVSSSRIRSVNLLVQYVREPQMVFFSPTLQLLVVDGEVSLLNGGEVCCR